MSRSVEPAEYAEVAAQRRYILLWAIVHADGHNVLARGGQCTGQFYAERPTRTPMLAKVPAIEVYIGNGASSLEPQGIAVLPLDRLR